MPNVIYVFTLSGLFQQLQMFTVWGCPVQVRCVSVQKTTMRWPWKFTFLGLFYNTGVHKTAVLLWLRDKTVVSNGFYFLNCNSIFLPFWWLEKLLFLQTAHSLNEEHICFMEQTISFLIQQRGLIIEGTVLIMLLKWRFWAKAIWVKVL